MECPTCGGEVYDNRAKNTERLGQGKKPMPEYKCKDESCGWVKWPPREAKAKGAPSIARGPKWTWDELGAMHRKSLVIAVANCRDAFKGKETPAEVIAAAATVFIAASREGVRAPSPAPEPADTMTDKEPY